MAGVFNQPLSLALQTKCAPLTVSVPSLRSFDHLGVPQKEEVSTPLCTHQETLKINHLGAGLEMTPLKLELLLQPE